MAAKRKARAPKTARKNPRKPKAPPAPVQAQVLAAGRASSHPLPADGEVVIGRGASAGLRIAHRSVAARHAVLFMGAGDRVMIEDLGGGTVVDGRALRAGERALVLPGEPVDLGEALLVLVPAPGRTLVPAVGPEDLREVLARACAEVEQADGDVVVAHVRADDEHDAATARAAVREALEPEDNLIADLDGSHWVVASAGVDGAALLLAGVRARLKDLRVKASVGLARHGALPDLDGLIRAARDELVPFEVPLRPGTVAASAAMRDVYRVAARAAATEVPVVLLGEPGVGKGVVAQELHQLSARRAGPLVHAHCHFIDEGELEELIAGAAGGTLFVEEIGVLPAPLQRRLARALARPARRAADRFRLVTSTSRDLGEDRAFSRALWARIAAFRLHVPPLRDRRQEIETLVSVFAPGAPLNAPAMGRLLRYAWPGNVRELKLTLERAVLDADGSAIDVSNLGLDPVRSAAV
ncbi:MAG TPA: sigma 54-interacting transcriptional regulator [Myxococcaceae bacterium]|nr:sigma 54-interacting transcriptional regulator [Myxococcaceae bacterium]